MSRPGPLRQWLARRSFGQVVLAVLATLAYAAGVWTILAHHWMAAAWCMFAALLLLGVAMAWPGRDR